MRWIIFLMWHFLFLLGGKDCHWWSFGFALHCCKSLFKITWHNLGENYIFPVIMSNQQSRLQTLTIGTTVWPIFRCVISTFFSSSIIKPQLVYRHPCSNAFNAILYNLKQPRNWLPQTHFRAYKTAQWNSKRNFTAEIHSI